MHVRLSLDVDHGEIPSGGMFVAVAVTAENVFRAEIKLFARKLRPTRENAIVEMEFVDAGELSL